MGASINCLFSRLLRHRFFAPAPKVGALGEIGIPYILYITTVLVRQPGQSSRILYTLRFSARWLLGLRPRPAGQPSAVVSASLRLLALIAMDGMYAGFALLQGCNLVEQCRSNCRGAKACREKIRIN
jgi:hypothetical protein